MGGLNPGDTGDPWPGSTGHVGAWNDGSDPPNGWDFNRLSGIEIVEGGIEAVSDGSLVTLVWNPTDVPSLQFLAPPGEASPEGIYQVRYQATDQYGGTTIDFFYTTVNGDYSMPDEDGDDLPDNFIGTMTKNPGVVQDSIDWDVSDLPDAVHHIFAKLTPGIGQDLCGPDPCEEEAVKESATES